MTLAHLVAEAAFEQGQWAQAFPAFGVERRGAPVEAFARIDDGEITDRSQVNEPTYVVVQDPSLLDFVDVCDGLLEDGMVVVNSTGDPSALALEHPGAVVTVDATGIAREYLGRPIANTALLGAFAGASGLLAFDSIAAATRSSFDGEIARKNVAAADAAFDEVREVAVA